MELKRILKYLICGSMLLLLAALPASATIILLDQSANCQGCANILFQDDDIGNPLQASTQSGSTIFLSQDVQYGNLIALSNGQARVEQESGLDFHGLFIDLSLTKTTLFEFTVQPLSNGDPAETMDVTINDNLGNVFTFTLGSVGQNRHTWQALHGQTIAGVDIQFNGGTVNAVEQIRLSEAAVVPEPASMALLGGGLAAIGFWARKRRVREISNHRS